MEENRMNKRAHCQTSSTEANSFKKSKVALQTVCIEKFIHVISRLTPDQRDIVQDLGFSHILGLSCPDVQSPLLFWLIDHLDPVSRTINLPSGFSFKINAMCVQKILGIPSGLPIHNKGTLEAYNFFKAEFPSKGITPTVLELCEMISEETSGCDFARKFMLLSLASFLCPNTKSVCSTKYYPPLVNVSSIRNLDWCSFVLDWLMFYIKKFQNQPNEEWRNGYVIGGCCHLILISYLEFLSTPSFNLGIACPRIAVWSQSIVNAATILDCILGSQTNFGNLQLKHLCCTPFKDAFSEENYSQYIFNTVKSIVKHNSPCASEAAMTNLAAELCTKLKDSVIPSKLPDLADSFYNVIASVFLSNNHSHHLTYLEDTDSDEDTRSLKVVKNMKSTDDTSQELHYLRKYFPHLKIPVMPDPERISISDIFHQVKLEALPQDDQLNEFSSEGLSYEELLCHAIQKMDLEVGNVDQHEEIDLLSLVEGTKSKVVEAKEDTKFIEDLLISIGTKMSGVCKIQQDSASSRDPLYGMSLNERLLGRSRVPNHSDVSQPEFPNFELLPEFDENQGNSDNPQHCSQWFDDDSLVQSLQRGFHNCADMLRDESHTKHNSRKTMITATEIEKKLYDLMTKNISKDRSERVFQNSYCWVDQYKLSLSMMPGGWLHFHVIDCFSRMLACHQELVKHVEGHIHQLFLQQNTVKILMNKSINFDNYKSSFLETVGFTLFEAGLVYIPCFKDNQWILVVVNFLHERFDILDSDTNVHKSKEIVHAVLFNFIKFFHRGYPNCLEYNINSFQINYVDVPKHKFRYDSGVFVLQFMQTYNGSESAQFNNDDIIALRSKFLFQLLTSRFNKVNCGFIQQFLRSNNMSQEH